MQHPTPYTFRFQVYVNGDYVRLGLRDGQSLTHYHWTRHEEGWTSEHYTWTRHGNAILREWLDEGRDCDGRHARGGTDAIDITCVEYNEYGSPIWGECEGERDWQYDQYAEMAGY